MTSLRPCRLPNSATGLRSVVAGRRRRCRFAFRSTLYTDRTLTPMEKKSIESFALAVPQEQLDDLRRRLSQIRWPERETVDDWSQGAPLQKVRALCEYWRDHYDLAQRLGVRPKVLSAALNEGLGQHFFDYVNRYRIEEARRLLTNPADPKVTVLEVMYQVGFNSKSSFNTLFRKYTGQTPSAVKKRSD
ncbi:MAG: helix-turn-helix domain-containing protein [Gemmatimonadaceae bacterium]|nr:helix-turn-helix domain-containing protein [Gloeobacterales cyanobacterium ES-bin-141]